MNGDAVQAVAEAISSIGPDGLTGADIAQEYGEVARLAIEAYERHQAQQRYWVGYFCPRGSGHYELLASDDYDPQCGSKGWNVYLDAEPDDEYLPEGDWR